MPGEWSRRLRGLGCLASLCIGVPAHAYTTVSAAAPSLAGLPVPASLGLEAGPAEPAAVPTGWRIGLDQALAFDSNPLRRPTPSAGRAGQEMAEPVSDRAATTAADAWLGAAWSRQAVHAWARAERTDHVRFPVLDHTAHAAQVAWDARVGADLGARLWWRSQSDLSDLGLRLDPVAGRPIEQRIRQVGAQGLWGVQRAWGLQVQWQRDQVRDARRGAGEADASARVDQDTLRGGVRLQDAGPWTLVVGARAVRGRQETDGAWASLAAPRDEQRLAELQGTWSPAAGRWWALVAAQGSGHRSLRLEGRWDVAPRLNGSIRYGQDEGLQAQVLQSLGEGARLWASSALSLRETRAALEWSPRPMWTLGAALQQLQRRDDRGLRLTVQDISSSASTGRLEDRTRRVQATVTWRLQPGLSLGCRVQSERREARLDAAAAWGSAPGHDARAWGCTLRAEMGRVGG